MAFNIPGVPSSIDAKSMGSFDLADALHKGLGLYGAVQEARYKPELLSAEILKKKGEAQKNAMLAKLLGSAFGGEGGEGGQGGGFGGGGNNFKAAVLKAFTGIDPYLMSPQEQQELKTTGAVQQAAKKANVTTGASDIARESLQNVVSIPKEYSGAFGSVAQAKDRLAAQFGDEDAKERLIQAAVAERLVPEYAGFQLQSQGQKGTVQALKHQSESIRQGWPKLSKSISDNLTPELQKEVERRHNEAVKNVNRLRESFLTSGGKARPKLEKINSSSEGKQLNPGAYSWADIKHTAERRGISENEVIDRLAKLNHMSVDEFMQQVKQMENR